MDNHKDFIHIDDVFRNLRNGEEKEPSGAWLRMKDLLDKEMPVGAPVAAGKSFRRFIIPLAALLLAGGGFTYYKMNQDSKSAASLNPSTTAVASHSAGNDKTDHLTSGNRNNDIDKNGDQQAIATSEKGTSGLTRGEMNHSKNNSQQHTNLSPNGNQQSASGQSPVAAVTKNNSTLKNIAGQKPAAAHSATSNKGHNETLASNTGKIPNDQVAHTPVVEQRVIEAIKPKEAEQNAKRDKGTPGSSDIALAANNTPKANTENQYGSKNGGLKQVATTLNDKIVQSTDGRMFKEQRDTFKRIDVVAREVASKAGGKNITKTVFDTVAITRFEKVSYVPLNPLEIVALQKIRVENVGRKMVPVANLKEHIVANEMVSMVPLANYKVASRRLDPSKFNQLVQNTSQGISNYFDGTKNFYAAVLLGGNSSFGNPGAFGLQLGIAGLFQLGERLTLAAELKYVNHYFSNYSLEDKSVTFENVNSQQLSGADWLFSGTQRTTTSAYKINSFGALEFPVTLSYNLGRVSVFGGLNMAYAMPIKWNKENTVNIVQVQKNNTENTNPFKDAAFTINEQDDFASRFGVGYVWGLNYDFSRKVSLDARLTQILWDNNKGNTDAIKRLFQVPTLQISVGYFFGRKDKVVYIMDKR